MAKLTPKMANFCELANLDQRLEILLFLSKVAKMAKLATHTPGESPDYTQTASKNRTGY